LNFIYLSVDFMNELLVILYVSDQTKSALFYHQLLGIDPELDVPGMTEFRLSPTTKLGLMPENGIAKILGGKTPHPSSGNGIPRCELYLKTENADEYVARACALGANEISPMMQRNWGDWAAYVADPDGHIIAFAESR